MITVFFPVRIFHALFDVAFFVPSLSECVPQQEGEAQPDDQANDDGVAPLPKVDLLHQAVNHGKPRKDNTFFKKKSICDFVVGFHLLDMSLSLVLMALKVALCAASASLASMAMLIWSSIIRSLFLALSLSLSRRSMRLFDPEAEEDFP